MNLTPTEQQFLKVITFLVNMSRDNSIKVSHRRLGKILKCTPTTSHRNIKRLKDKGLIEIERPGGRENVYRLAG